MGSLKVDRVMEYSTDLLFCQYSGISLKRHPLERTPLWKGPKCLPAITLNNRCDTPSHQRTPNIKGHNFLAEGGSVQEGNYWYVVIYVPACVVFKSYFTILFRYSEIEFYRD